ncbi:hypothetical protein FDP41_007461 [Naegleria fowleri]|uniref:Uncharacterized protein n=1 Tax=Naegleria fowleri TaxID=5763 RepID=A0A6A5CCJ8_NAEFO|nr:uncharacterized protein FDP41_007461 [Naegleria fowleri]KAF0984284.1 hypothetical protein FDP41_007461 [Naegleria fowleri]CAG4707700.1 unnamed protein product [Naegleria fowleri]
MFSSTTSTPPINHRVFNPYDDDDDPFQLGGGSSSSASTNQNDYTTTTTTNMPPTIIPSVRSSSQQQGMMTSPRSAGASVGGGGIIQSTPTPTTTSDVNSSQGGSSFHPRRVTIGFEDDFASDPGVNDVNTNFTIESTDFLLSMASPPSHRHTVSGESSGMLSCTFAQHPHQYSVPSMPVNQKQQTQNSSHTSASQTSTISSPVNPGNSTMTSTRAVTATTNTPRQSVASESGFQGSELNFEFKENPKISGIKSVESSSVKRRSRTMFEGNTNRNNISKDLLDFGGISDPIPKQENYVMDHDVMSDEKTDVSTGSETTTKQRPTSMKVPSKTTTTSDVSNSSPSSLHVDADHKMTIPETILMILLSDSGIVKSYASDSIEELCMLGILCELIIHKKLTTLPMRDQKGQNGLLVVDNSPIQSQENCKNGAVLELMNEVLFLVDNIILKCPAKEVNKLTIKDWIKILCSGRKIQHVTINKVSHILTRLGKQLSDRSVVEYKKTLFLFLSLPIKNKVEKERAVTELTVYLRMLRTELQSNIGLSVDESSFLNGSIAYDTACDRFLKNRHDFVIFSLLGIFTLCSVDVLSNDILKPEQDKKALRDVSFSIFNISIGSFINKKKNNTTFESKKRTSIFDEIVDSDSEDNNILNSPGELSPATSTTSINGDKKVVINPFPDGLSFIEETALHLKRCIYSGCK